MGRIEYNNKLLVKIVLFFSFIILAQIVLGYIIFEMVTLAQVQHGLISQADRIKNDLVYENGKWDIERYTADPQTPHPNGSSGFTQPLYIFSSDGFVIERNSPIKGLLDASNFKYLLSFSKPTTITTETNERWRILAYPITGKSGTIGVAFVSYYNPNNLALESIDAGLTRDAAQLIRSVQVNNDAVDAHGVDARAVSYATSFEIVNSFNKVLVNNGRTPSFIDQSYVADALAQKNTRLIADERTHEQFMIFSSPVYANNAPVGVVIIGRSIQTIQNSLRQYVIYTLLLGLVIIIPITILTVIMFRREMHKIMTSSRNKPQAKPKRILFDDANGMLYLDNHEIAIPYDSNQYYLLKALISKPKKKWETDELLKTMRLEEEAENWRKIYDAMMVLNKKFGFKLILYKNRQYSINTEYTDIISIQTS